MLDYHFHFCRPRMFIGADGRFCGGLEISVVENVHKHGKFNLVTCWIN